MGRALTDVSADVCNVYTLGIYGRFILVVIIVIEDQLSDLLRQLVLFPKKIYVSIYVAVRTGTHQATISNAVTVDARIKYLFIYIT